MDIIITGRKVNLKDNFKDMVRDKLVKFDRIFGESEKAYVTVTVENRYQRVEITIRHQNRVYRSESDTDDMNESLDNAVNAIGRQIHKNKSRLQKQIKSESIDDYIAHAACDSSGANESESKIEIARTKKIPVKPLSVEEAILEMDLVGHQFYMFTNCETDEINVVYKRKNGKYGLLEPSGY
ncbi:MAG: ribosome-associated translation inhibitor RaiA [Oscillospiraceae bacterium]|jgi:putative sigma-54 modulation protein|nr:ribosome-associated translation inhibitor RaiA [Oscillospiraceae bacterium]